MLAPETAEIPDILVARSGDAPAGSPRFVLLIEPSAPQRAWLAGVLEAGGVEVQPVADLAAAAAVLGHSLPSAILARWDPPTIDALERIGRLAKNLGDGWAPLILLGGPDTTPAGRALAIERGAFDVLTTTVPAAELRARVRAAVRLRQRIDVLERRAYRDSLTGLINRGALDDHLSRQWETALRHGTSLSVVVVDLDRFKQINDVHGHPTGDDALRHAAGVLTRSVRASDVVARYGGDEFLIVAPTCPPESAIVVARRIRAGLAIDSPNGMSLASLRLTVSVGIAGTGGPAAIELDELIRRADQALYLAKRSGRDAIALFDPEHRDPRLVT